MKAYLVIWICLLEGIAAAGVPQVRTQKFDAFPLSTYRDAGNVKVVQCLVPEFTDTQSFFVQVYAVTSNSVQLQPDRDCPLRNVTIYTQHGAQPLIVRGGLPQKDEFFIQRTSQASATVSIDNAQVILSIDRPQPGLWYLAAFLEPSGADDDVITQKGLGVAKKCVYLFNLLHLYVVSSPSAIFDVPVNSASRRYVLVDKPAGTTNGSGGQFEAAVGSSALFRVAPFANQQFTVFAFEFIIERCAVLGGIDAAFSEPCPLAVSADRSASTPPNPSKSAAFINCSLNASRTHDRACTLIVAVSNMLRPTYVSVTSWTDRPVTFDVRVRTHKCAFAPGAAYNDVNATQIHIFDPLPLCSVAPPLAKFYALTQRFNFVLFDAAQPNFYSLFTVVRARHVPIVPFNVDHLADQGGTLSFYFWFVDANMSDVNASRPWRVDICVTRHSLPITLVTPDLASWLCDPLVALSSNLSATRTETAVYYPYPESGLYFLAFRFHHTDAHDDADANTTSPLSYVRVRFTVRSAPCLDGSCNGNAGECVRTSSFQNLRFAFCSCKVGYGGFYCTNASAARSLGWQALELTLLTASNAAMLPAVVLAARRRFWMEAAVYAFTTGASTLYHVCDSDTQLSYCLLPHPSLSLLDFFGSLASFLVTTLCIAELQHANTKALVLTLSLLVALVAVTTDRFAISSFVIPIVVCFLVLIISWSRRCYASRACHPPRRQWLTRFLPGFLLLLVGLSFFLFLERKSNYYLVHSTWHVLVALACAVLLPPRTRKSPPPSHNALQSASHIVLRTRTQPHTSEQNAASTAYLTPVTNVQCQPTVDCAQNGTFTTTLTADGTSTPTASSSATTDSTTRDSSA